MVCSSVHSGFQGQGDHCVKKYSFILTPLSQINGHTKNLFLFSLLKVLLSLNGTKAPFKFYQNVSGRKIIFSTHIQHIK